MRKGWEIKKLGEVCEIYAGGDVPKNNYTKTKTEEYKIPIFSNGEKNKGLYGYTDVARVTKPSITISARGTIGYSEIRLEAFYPAIRLLVVTPNTNILNLLFLKYVISNIDFAHSGSSIPQLTVPMVKEYLIPLPPITLQQSIVKLLEEAFEKIDILKTNAERNLQNAKELFQSALTEKLKLKVGWEVKKLKEIGKAQTGTTPKTVDKENFGDFIPFIKPADIDIKGNGVIRYDHDGLSEKGLRIGRKMHAGSILMVCIGATIGKVGFADRDVSCNQQINALTVKDGFSTKFIYYALSTKTFFEQVLHNAAQATLPIINKGKWETLTICFPKSLKAQQTIVEHLDALSAHCKGLEANYQKTIVQCEEMKKAVLGKAFRGEL